MTKDEAMALVRSKMTEKGIPPSRWGFATGPARVVFLSRGNVGDEQRELPLKRSLRKAMIEDWIDRNVKA